MAYNPSLYNPYGLQPAQPVNGLIRVESIEGAQMYQLPPNSVSPPLFLGSENAFFIKTTDGGGAATLKKYTFEEEAITNNVSGEFVTREYFDQQINNIMEAINGKRAVPEPTATATTGQLDTQPTATAPVPGTIQPAVQ